MKFRSFECKKSHSIFIDSFDEKKMQRWPKNVIDQLFGIINWEWTPNFTQKYVKKIHFFFFFEISILWMKKKSKLIFIDTEKSQKIIWLCIRKEKEWNECKKLQKLINFTTFWVFLISNECEILLVYKNLSRKEKKKNNFWQVLSCNLSWSTSPILSNAWYFSNKKQLYRTQCSYIIHNIIVLNRCEISIDWVDWHLSDGEWQSINGYNYRIKRYILSNTLHTHEENNDVLDTNFPRIVLFFFCPPWLIYCLSYAQMRTYIICRKQLYPPPVLLSQG